MNHHGLAWLARQIVGLYLFAQGLAVLPDVIVTGGLENQMYCYIPLVAGMILLGLKSPPRADAAAATSSISLGLDRFDCFWLVCKACGLLAVLYGSQQTVTFLVWVSMMSRSDAGMSSDNWASIAVGLLPPCLGLWLLFSNALPRAIVSRAAREAEAEARIHCPSGDSRGQHLPRLDLALSGIPALRWFARQRATPGARFAHLLLLAVGLCVAFAAAYPFGGGFGAGRVAQLGVGLVLVFFAVRREWLAWATVLQTLEKGAAGPAETSVPGDTSSARPGGEQTHEG